MSNFGWFFAGMCIAFGGQLLGMLWLAKQRQRFSRYRPPRSRPMPCQGSGNGHGGPSTAKPPLGLRPRFIADEERLREVADAITRYRVAGKPVPVEWLREHDELGYRLQHTWDKPQPHGGRTVGPEL
jgi:hypothetical protein